MLILSPFRLFHPLSFPTPPYPCSPSFLSRSRANSLRWWFPSFLRTRGPWQRPQHSRVSSCPLDSTTSPAAVSPFSTHSHVFINGCSVELLCGVWCFSPGKVESEPFSHTGSWIISQKASLPLQQHLSLNRKTSPNTPFLFTLSIFPSLSPSLAQSIWLLPFCLVYFLMYKSNKIQASYRTCFLFFVFLILLSFFFLAITLRLCGNVLFTMIERETERKRGGCLPGDAGNKCAMGG